MTEAEARQKLRADLQTAYNDGYRIEQALPRPGAINIGHMLTGYVATDQDVQRWQAHVEHLLSDEPRLVAVFLHDPPPPPTTKAFAAAVSLMDSEQRRRMRQRLRQLEQIIKKL